MIYQSWIYSTIRLYKTKMEEVMCNFPKVPELQSALHNLEATTSERFRAIYYLRTIHEKAVKDSLLKSQAVKILASALQNSRNSPLLRHECAYVLGQMQDSMACGILEDVLKNEMDDIMVRHECGEALGAIGDPRSLELLESCARSSSEIEVAETCQIASDFLKWKLKKGENPDSVGKKPIVCACMSPYNSHDPAPPDPEFESWSTQDVGAILSKSSAPLFRRYGAMFCLRNRGGTEAVSLLGKALISDSTSALLRHEIAFVLGQMQNPAAIDFLEECLERPNEHGMVRHEAAEAIGALEGDEKDWERCRSVLVRFSKDSDGVVRESCEVALDAADYWCTPIGISESAKSFGQLKRDSERGAECNL